MVASLNGENRKNRARIAASANFCKRLSNRIINTNRKTGFWAKLGLILQRGQADERIYGRGINVIMAMGVAN
ncbi:hypothetical protein TH25_18285 [Thalassospira profundimaris]|uniref:Uncharacterized protein n=1 Tax=Thalassospira profundimaris TaxID=502049 RepID=A0A367WV00_9PROT|nr:hypothetical protein TH25_18285 [Thalassospira profundimaris]